MNKIIFYKIFHNKIFHNKIFHNKIFHNKIFYNKIFYSLMFLKSFNESYNGNRGAKCACRYINHHLMFSPF